MDEIVELDSYLYVYWNTDISEKEIYSRHPYSTIIYIKFKSLFHYQKKFDNFINSFLEQDIDFHTKKNSFVYNKKNNKIIIRFPIKETDNLTVDKIKEKTWRDAINSFNSAIKKDLDSAKIYIDNKLEANIDKILLKEKNMAYAERNHKALNNKKHENYNPDDSIKYAKESDIDRAKYNLGEIEFRRRIKYDQPLFTPQENLHYNNQELYDRYVKPYEKEDKKKK